MDELNEDEVAALEGVIGAGVSAIGQLDTNLISACRKLGLEPVNWEGDPLLPTT